MLSSACVDRLQSYQPKLIFFDIDGTLLNTHGHYSPNLKQQLYRLHSKGIKLAIASGRPAIAAQFLFDDLPLTAAGLFCTGAELYEPLTQQHLRLHLLDQKDIVSLYQHIKQRCLYCEFYTPEYHTFDPGVLTNKLEREDIKKIHSEHLRVVPKLVSDEDVIQQNLPITKLLLGVNESKYGDQLRSLAADFPQLEFAFAHFLARPDWLFTSVVHRKADKQQGFDWLVNYHQVNSEEVVAFGDSQSDMVFLQQAGLGIATGNASDQVKSVADIVTLSSDEDGVAQALQYLAV